MAKDLHRKARRYKQMSEDAQSAGHWQMAEHYRHLAQSIAAQARHAGRHE